jgi:hypothetical protein
MIPGRARQEILKIFFLSFACTCRVEQYALGKKIMQDGSRRAVRAAQDASRPDGFRAAAHDGRGFFPRMRSFYGIHYQYIYPYCDMKTRTST